MSAAHALTINWTACEGRGLCADLLPELLEPDPWGFPKTRDGAQHSRPGLLTAVPARLEPHARRAVHLCPRLALQLTEQPKSP